PGARVYAVESAPAALAWLRRNAAGYPAVTVLAGDATDPGTAAALDGTAALVLANPPYVPAGTPVPPELARHDPPGALCRGPPGALRGGREGLAVLPGVVARAADLLQPGGWFGTEHDETHAAGVTRLLAARGLTEVATHPDLAGRPRFTTGRRPPL